jgi:mRNA-degrading endonuclease RelE of RelBE toxin-antitoxin system
MPTSIRIAAQFEKPLKRLSRKYPALLKEIGQLINQLKQDERPGDKIPHVGYDVYKVRLKNPSASRGKSGGFRVIYYVQIASHVILVTIYSKTEQTDIGPEEIRHILQDIENPDQSSD